MADVQRIDLLDPAEVARFGGIEIVAQGVVEGFLSGIHRSPFRGFSVEFTEHRAYQPGDELRYLDWKILARADRLYVKQFEEETNLRAMILLDASRSMAWRGDPARLTKRGYADRLVAALALILLRQRDATGLMTFDEAVRQGIPARVKAGQWTRLVRGLIDTPDGLGTAAETALRQLAGLLARRGLVVLVSDLLLDRGLALTALRYLRHRGHQVIVLHVMDPAELELAGPPEVRFRDPESAASVVVRPRALAGAYAATVRRALAGGGDGAGGRAADVPPGGGGGGGGGRGEREGLDRGARADGARCRARQLVVGERGGRRAAGAGPAQGAGACVARPGRAGRSPLARARGRRGARGLARGAARERGRRHGHAAAPGPRARGRRRGAPRRRRASARP